MCLQDETLWVKTKVIQEKASQKVLGFREFLAHLSLPFFSLNSDDSQSGRRINCLANLFTFASRN